MKDENNKIREAAEERILSFWKKMKQDGVEFFVDGEVVRPSDAYSRAVKEDGIYMTDYVWGDKGQIKQVRLNKVDQE